MKKSFVLKWFITLLAIYAGWCGVLYLNQESFIFFPFAEHAEFPVPGELKWEEVDIQTQDGETLNGFWMDNRAEQTILFFHGNGGNISHRMAQLFLFSRLGKNALMIDYRGYGKSTGVIKTEEDLYNDGRAALTFLMEKNISPKNIILWGESLGTGVVIELAQKTNFAKIVLEAPFLSLQKVAQGHYPFLPVRFLLKYTFDNESKMKNVLSPLLFFQSKEDEVVPFEQSEQLFQLSTGSKKFVEVQGTHNSLLSRSVETYMSELKEFLK